jgi:NADH-ubiquinone oxidoreductase chain 6
MTGLEVFPMLTSLKYVLTFLAIISGMFVIGTKNAIIPVFNLIVLYILVAFWLIYIGVTYLGIAYIVVYIGAIAILFLFIIMMIDIEVVEKRNNNYLPLLFLLIVGFVVTLKNILYTMGVMKIKSLVYYDKEEVLMNKDKETLLKYRVEIYKAISVLPLSNISNNNNVGISNDTENVSYIMPIMLFFLILVIIRLITMWHSQGTIIKDLIEIHPSLVKYESRIKDKSYYFFVILTLNILVAFVTRLPILQGINVANLPIF